MRFFQSLYYIMSSSYWEMRWQTVFDDMLQLGQHVNSLEDRHLETSTKCSPQSQMSILKRCLACVLAFPFGFRAKKDRGARNGKPPSPRPFHSRPFSRQIHVRICYDRWVFATVANSHFSIYGYLLPQQIPIEISSGYLLPKMGICYRSKYSLKFRLGICYP